MTRFIFILANFAVISAFAQDDLPLAYGPLQVIPDSKYEHCLKKYGFPMLPPQAKQTPEEARLLASTVTSQEFRTDTEYSKTMSLINDLSRKLDEEAAGLSKVRSAWVSRRDSDAKKSGLVVVGKDLATGAEQIGVMSEADFNKMYAAYEDRNDLSLSQVKTKWTNFTSQLNALGTKAKLDSNAWKTPSDALAAYRYSMGLYYYFKYCGKSKIGDTNGSCRDPKKPDEFKGYAQRALEKFQTLGDKVLCEDAFISKIDGRMRTLTDNVTVLASDLTTLGAQDEKIKMENMFRDAANQMANPGKPSMGAPPAGEAVTIPQKNLESFIDNSVFDDKKPDKKAGEKPKETKPDAQPPPKPQDQGSDK